MACSCTSPAGMPEIDLLRVLHQSSYCDVSLESELFRCLHDLVGNKKRIPPDWGPQWLTEKIKDGTTHRFEIYFERDQYDTMDGNNDYNEDAGWKLDGMQRGPAIECYYGLSRLAIASENVTALGEFFNYAYRGLIRNCAVQCEERFAVAVGGDSGYSACLTGKISRMESKQLFRLTFLRVHIVLVTAEMLSARETTIGNYYLICKYIDTCFSPRKVDMQ